MQPQNNQPNANPGVTPTPETTPTPLAAITPATEMPAPTKPASSPNTMTEPAVNPVPESTNISVQPAALTKAPSDSYTKSTKSKSKLFIILGIVLVALAGIGFGVWYLFTSILVPNKYGNIQLKVYEADSSFSVLAPSKEPNKTNVNTSESGNVSYEYIWDMYDNDYESPLKMNVGVAKINPNINRFNDVMSAMNQITDAGFSEATIKKEVPEASNIATDKNTTTYPYWWTAVYE